MNASSVFDRSRQGLSEIPLRADRFFLSDAVRGLPAIELANARMGIFFCLVGGLSCLAFLPVHASIWGDQKTTGLAFAGLSLITLPFVLRGRPTIRFLGHLVCALVALASISSLFFSGGQSVGILPLLAVLPMIGLLVGGKNGAGIWSVVSLAVAGFGLALIGSDFTASPNYADSTDTHRYTTAIICILGMGCAVQFFEAFWNRTAIEVADRAQADLIAQEELNRIFFEHTTEGILIVNTEGIIQFASPATARIAGVEHGEVVGRPLSDFVAAEDHLRAAPVWQQLCSDPKGVANITMMGRPRPDATRPSEFKRLDVTGENHMENPAVRGILIRARDITELANAEANYQTLVERSLQGIAVECDGRIVFANQALANLLQVTRDDLLRSADSNALAQVHPEDRESVATAFNDSSLSLPDPTEMRFKRADGTFRWLQLQWTEATWEGRPSRQILYVDTTAQKELAAQRKRETERLEAAIRERTSELEVSQKRLFENERMAAIGTLAAGIAHQINNPVGAILTSADFALLTAEEPDAEKIRDKALRDIRAEAIRCGKIARSVLQFSRSEPTEKWSGDLSTVLRTAVDVTSRYAEEQDATIHLSLAPEGTGRTVSMNPIELEQVFVNLIRNAVEARSSGVEVRISTNLVGDEFDVVVQDDGPGVREADSKHLFDPFYTTRLQYGGTGLGLSVAHGIVEDHGGRMWLDQPADGADHPSSRRPGARFHIRLPIEKPPTPV